MTVQDRLKKVTRRDQLGPLLPLVLAVVLPLAAAFLTASLWNYGERRLSLFLLAVIWVGLYGGFIPSVVSAIASLALAVLIIADLHLHSPVSPANTKEFVSFVFVLALAVLLGKKYSDSQRRLRAALRSQEDIVAIVSHDLRNPVTAIKLSADQLASENPAVAERIQASTDRVERLIDDLLENNRFERGAFVLNRTTESVADLLRTVEDAYAGIAVAGGKHLGCDRPLPEIDLLLDRHRIERVLGNLISNAIKYANPGSTIRMGVKVHDQALEFYVADEGPGLRPNEAAKIFEAYWQTNGRREGMGLGLYIASEIVRAHGGKMGVDSTPGKGSRFYFTLPRRA